MQYYTLKPDDDDDSTDYYASANRWQIQSQKVQFGAYFTPQRPRPLTFWAQNLTRSSLPQSLLAVKVWSNFIDKYSRYLANNVCLGLMHEHPGNIMPLATMLVEA